LAASRYARVNEKPAVGGFLHFRIGQA